MTKIKDLTRKVISIILSTMIIISALPVQAYAEIKYDSGVNDYGEEVDESILVDADNNDVTVTGGDIHSDEYETYQALKINVQEENTAEVTTGNIIREDGSGIVVNNYPVEEEGTGGTAEVTVNGDVSVDSEDCGIGVITGKGTSIISVDGSVSSDYWGIKSQTNHGKTQFTINNGVSGKRYGIEDDTFFDGKTEFTVNGNIDSEYKGLYTKTGYEGSSIFNINGDINGDLAGISNWSYIDGASTFLVNGNINGGAVGAEVYADGGGSADIEVNGNITAGECGIYAEPYKDDGDEYGKIYAWVGGTISAKEIGIGLEDDPDSRANVTVTAWKIIPNENGAVAGYYVEEGEDERIVEDGNFEKNNINYIIKVEQPSSGATISASRNTAKEGETVTLRINLQEGYMVTGAFGDGGKSVPLLQDAAGNYYVVVPKGGGVYLSVTLYLVPPEPEAEPEPEPEVVIPVTEINADLSDNSQTVPDQSAATDTTPAVTAAEISTQIINALAVDPIAGSVDLNIGASPSIGKDVMEALCENSSVAKNCSFTVDGKKYVLSIPAFDPDSELYRQCLALLALEPGGVAGPIRLAQIFAALGFRIIEV